MYYRVSFVTQVLTHYRRPFHERVREILAEHGLEYQLIYGNPVGVHKQKKDCVDLAWGERTRNFEFSSPFGPLYWQNALHLLRNSDLVIVSQESRLLINYILMARRSFGLTRLASFGHGRNFQSRGGRLAAGLKRRLIKNVDWWFAYTAQSKRIVQEAGFPPHRITVLNNSIDTSFLRRSVAEHRNNSVEVRRELGLGGTNVGLFVGGLYPDKRLEFLVESAVRIREQVRDFELIIIGGGPSSGVISNAASLYSWMKYMGPLFGEDQARCLAVSQLLLMPGLVGLATVDAFAAGLPCITTDYPFHSPEIEYLCDGINGAIVPDWMSPEKYASRVAGILCDKRQLSDMQDAALRSAEEFSIEKMAQRFVSGVLSALDEAGAEKRV